VLSELRGGCIVSRLDAALAAARRGWPVFPLWPGLKRPRAELTDWERRATCDPACIEAWWSRHPADNIAIATGPAGLVVVDLDLAPDDAPRPAEHPAARGGTDVFAALAAGHGHPPGATWIVETASGGRHLYYQAPKDGGPWRNTAGRIGWHIDTRAGGGYVVAAGSTVAGRPYTVIHDHSAAPLPDWLAQLLTPSATVGPTSPARAPATGASYGAAALAGEVTRVLDAPVGHRNAALNRAAWNLARHIATGHLSRPDVEDALSAAGQAAGGQSPAGVAATIRSAIDARLRRGSQA
jgi:Bifunctional DNA primase/polymerase, N-terminal